MTMENFERLKEEWIAEATERAVQQITAKKKADSAWTRAKKELEPQVKERYGLHAGYWIFNSVSTIARKLWHVNTVSSFDEIDVTQIKTMLNELLGVVEKYNIEA
ncbi:MAG TPA: hypothetical protein DEQ02_08115 [Ruminococcaceae bacterium]|nr:hypothetical protein [Oscillospiraceae bacterium]